MNISKGFKITVILILLSNYLYSQVDSIRSQILEYEDSKSTLISKGRKLLLDKFLEGDLKKVKEVKDFLVDTEDDDYIALYPAEHWYISFWTGDYPELVNSFRNFDSVRTASYKTRISPYPTK